MKKYLSLFISVALICTTVFAVPFTSQAAESYNNSVISSNINTIKKYIRNNGFINGNGNYTIQYTETSEELDFYNLMIVDSADNSLYFSVNVEDSSTGDLFGVVKLEIEPPTTSVMCVNTYYWISGYDYSDLEGHAYIDKNYNHNTDYANFYIDYNDEGVDSETAFELFDSMLSAGFENWDYMLNYILDMNMGAVGFHSYCTAHTYKKVVTKATTSKNGQMSNACSICGKVKSSTAIAYPKTITLSSTSYIYDGKAKKPSVTVKDSKGKKIASSNYTVTYSSGRKNVGKYTVTIKFKGNYSGTVKKTFTIKPKSTTISKLTAGKKAFTVKLKKQATQTTGYQIQYSTSSNFKNAKSVTVSKNSITSKKISKLKAKKKYYVRVRTYKMVNGSKIYSSWSKAKTVKTK